MNASEAVLRQAPNRPAAGTEGRGSVKAKKGVIKAESNNPAQGGGTWPLAANQEERRLAAGGWRQAAGGKRQAAGGGRRAAGGKLWCLCQHLSIQTRDPLCETG